MTAPFIRDAVIIGQQFQTAGNTIYESSQEAYSGFVNLFLNGQARGAGQMALGIAGLIPDFGETEQIAERMATGHAFEKHAGELAAVGVSSKEDLKSLIKETMRTATGADVKQLDGGRIAFWNESKKVVVISCHL